MTETTSDKTTLELTADAMVETTDDESTVPEVTTLGRLVPRNGLPFGGKLRFQGDLVEADEIKATPLDRRNRNYRVNLWTRVLASEVVEPDEAELARRAKLQQLFDEAPAREAAETQAVESALREARIQFLAEQHPFRIESQIRDVERQLASGAVELALLTEARERQGAR